MALENTWCSPNQVVSGWSLLGRVSDSLGLITQSLGDINQRLPQGQYFFKYIRNQGIEIYSADKLELALAGDLTLAEQKKISEKHYKQWFSSVRVFLETFWIMMERDLTQTEYINHAAFSLHQATERFYACILLVTTNYLPKIHNIEKLRTVSSKTLSSSGLFNWMASTPHNASRNAASNA